MPLDEPSEVDRETIVTRFRELTEVVKGLVDQSDEQREWFAMWLPVIGAVVRFGGTLTKLAFRLQQMVGAEEAREPIGDTLREELVEDARSIRDEFPDVADAFFGLRNVDDLIDAIASDATARRSAGLLLEAVADAADKVVGRMIDIALGRRQSTFGPDRVVALLDRYEEIAQRLLDRWLLPTLSRTKREGHDADT